MRQLIYYVATSIDGYISGLHNDIEGFVADGDGVEQYLKDLQSFDTVIMGRNTYEFGYNWGLQPGKKAYPHMKHYIVSNTLSLPQADPEVMVCKPDLEFVRQLKAENGTAIYLAGGGELAGWLLDHRLIDVVKIKLNPLILGQGVRIFGSSQQKYRLQTADCHIYTNGLTIVAYNVQYK